MIGPCLCKKCFLCLWSAITFMYIHLDILHRVDWRI
jgi:hypothetical protein